MTPLARAARAVHDHECPFSKYPWEEPPQQHRNAEVRIADIAISNYLAAMRELPEPWKLTPREPTAEMLGMSCGRSTLNGTLVAARDAAPAYEPAEVMAVQAAFDERLISQSGAGT